MEFENEGIKTYLNSFKERIQRKRSDIIDNIIIDHVKNDKTTCTLNDISLEIHLDTNEEVFYCKNCKKDILKMKRW